MRVLSPLQARVLAVLLEKQHTVRDSYPLSLNALVAGCNQKTARVPVIEASDAEVQDAVDALKALSLVFEGGGNRVTKYEHNIERGLALPGQAAALLAVLVLRGPQTAAELRLNSERLHRFADLSSVEGFLDEMAAKQPARVLKLARAPGAREARWTHLLCGDVAPAAVPTANAVAGALAGDAPDAGATSVAVGELAALRAEQLRLAAEVAELRGLVQRLAAELGVS